jgi:hypothetical protein
MNEIAKTRPADDGKRMMAASLDGVLSHRHGSLSYDDDRLGA